jgi:hypothetical protein
MHLTALDGETADLGRRGGTATRRQMQAVIVLPGRQRDRFDLGVLEVYQRDIDLPMQDVGDHVDGDAELRHANERRGGREAGGVVDLHAVRDELGPPAEMDMQVCDCDLATDGRGDARLDQRDEPVPVPDNRGPDDQDGRYAKAQRPNQWPPTHASPMRLAGQCGPVLLRHFKSIPG